MKHFLTMIKSSVLLSLIFITGCGYHAGSIANPHVKTIAIAPVQNNTMEPLASTYLRKMLAEQFFVDGSLKVTDAQEADCILYATIKDVDTTGTGYDNTNDGEYSAAQWQLRIKASFAVIIPGKAKAFIPERDVTGSATFFVTVDSHTARRNGLQQACLNIAENIVQNTTEAW